MGTAADITRCSLTLGWCGPAFMAERTGERGPFLGCRRYPRCKSTLALT
ncbi:hypothetical protein E3N86_06335 [Cryobacterium sp. Hz7]|nr:hypothetical protein E3N86_06335 [Cryobacterium sp. Hz7]TFC26530.1 hypothetical protein E3O22_13020 [Cryobacterium sp. TMT2-18-2]TFC68085.1 hypothetical protein E3O53_01350 [Cryobacterium sp. TMT2-18-3]